MERMRTLKRMEDYESNWRSLNQQVYDSLSQHKHYITNVAVRATYYYCEECGKEMYWPIIKVQTRMKYYDTTNSCRYEDYQIDAYWFDKIPALTRLEKVCDTINHEYYAFRDSFSLRECPLCGAPAQRKEGYYAGGAGSRSDIGYPVYEIYSTYNPKQPKYNQFSDEALEAEMRGRFEEMGKTRIKNAKEENRKTAEQYASSRINEFQIQVQDSSEPEVWSSINGEIVKNSPDNLKIFLMDILKMETSILGFNQRLEELYKQKKSSELQHKLDAEFDDKKKRQLEREAAEIEKELEKYSPSMTSLGIRDPGEPRKVSEPTLSKPGLFNKKKVEAENKRLMDEYQEKVKEYNDSYQRYQVALAENQRLYSERVEEGKNELKKKIEEKKQEIATLSQETEMPSSVETIIEKEIDTAENALKETYTQRNNFYNTDIVYIKYRNPVALASFCEYLVSGRCTELEGPNGAYNIYENEIRVDRITDQLDKVLVSLDQIKSNQYTIYSELVEMNTSLKSLNSSLNNAIKSIDQIEKNSRVANERLAEISSNTAVTAYYSKVNAYYAKKTAETAKAIGWLVALK